jgi:hypothetical protein
MKLKKIANKLNLLKLIDELEFLHEENIEEEERKQMVEEAVALCKKAIKEHLHEYLDKNPSSSYEEWIRALHPDNAEYIDEHAIDHRFYCEDSDHRIMWNEYIQELNTGLDDRFVEARIEAPRYDHSK